MGVQNHLGSFMALNYDFRNKSENVKGMNLFKKSFKSNIKILVQITLGFSSIIMNSALNLTDNPI